MARTVATLLNVRPDHVSSFTDTPFGTGIGAGDSRLDLPPEQPSDDAERGLFARAVAVLCSDYEGKPSGDKGSTAASFCLMEEPSWSLRAARPEDYEFLFALHEATMREYVERVWGWDDDEQARILRSRFSPEGWHIIQSQNQDIGLLVIDEEDDAIRLAEIELALAWQGRGIGSSIVRWLMNEAATAGKPLTLRVLHVNGRARALYERLGFRPFKEIETHVYLRWSASGERPR